MEAELTITHEAGRLILAGELDGETAHRLGEGLAGLDGAHIEVDLANVSFIDSSGLRAILIARDEHGGARFVNPSRQVVRLLEITGTSTHVLGHG